MKKLKTNTVIGLVGGLILIASAFLYVRDNSSSSLSASEVRNELVFDEQNSAIREATNAIANPIVDNQLASQSDTSPMSLTTSSTPSRSGQNNDSNIEQEDKSVNQADEPESLNEDEIDSEAPRLTQRVMNVIAEVQTRQLDGQWEEVLNEMNALYSEFEGLNSFEQTTLLNFYTNTLLQLEMWQESISAFSLMLTIPDLRADINSRAIIALGQLHNRVGESATAISYYEQWLEFTNGMENMEEQTQRVRQLIVQASESSR